MCGISGFVNNNLNQDDQIRIINNMNNSLKHRGPDFQDYWIDPNNKICLGHTRLSILDLSTAGNQPMRSENDRYIICYNGETYNHLEIRKLVEKKSYTPLVWKGTSDTETILKSIQVFGFEKTLDLIRGMFSLILFDRKENTFYAAIDRFGEKPFYFGNVNNTFVFASELKAIKQYDKFNNEIDVNSVDDYMRYSCIRAPRTIYKKIYKLEPGSMIKININNIFNLLLDKNFLQHDKFYKFWFRSKDNFIDSKKRSYTNFDIARNDLENVLIKSVKSQLISDVPIGSFLSGGIDSSLITRIMTTQSDTKIKSFTIGFTENDFDESKYAKEISQIIGTEHYEKVLSPTEALSLVPTLSRVYDEPFADSSQIPTLLLSQFTKSKVKVALSGDGGDELFGGYNRYFWMNKIWKFFSWLPFEARKLIGKILSTIPPNKINLFYFLIFINKNKIKDNFVGEKAIKTFKRLQYVRNLDDLFISLTTEWNWTEKPVLNSTNKKINLYEEFTELKDYDYREKMMYWDINNYLPNDILCKVDRASMSQSLESRSPFLDLNVFNISNNIPIYMKINKNGGKLILKEILKKYIPEKYIERPKQGFGIPLAQWLRYDLRDWSESLLNSELIKSQGIFNYKIISKCWEEHKNEKFNNHNKLWPILMFQAWMQNN